MNKKRYNDVVMYAFMGIIFLFITIDLIFPVIMVFMKIVFWCIGTILIIGSLIDLKRVYIKNKNQKK